jgi:hypothetical protein
MQASKYCRQSADMMQVATSTGLIHKKYCYDVCSAHKVSIKHEMPQPAKLVYVKKHFTIK